MDISSIFGGGRLSNTHKAQARESEENQMAQTGAQMMAEKKKTAAQIHQIEQETNTKVSEMFRQSNLNRAKSASKIHQKWVQQIMA